MKYTYNEVIDIIQNTKRFGNHTGLEVSTHMLEQLGNPQCGIPFVHVAGTNGKGSTTAFLCKILEQTGKKIGMFTSPHLVDFEERIRINGAYISKADVTRLGNQLIEMEFTLSPTMFDYCLAMAVLYFKEQNCDLMVMETGIGGRYDSTNALGIPEVAIITKIGFDHMAILGNTLEAIAGEKAGIIKAGCPVVTTAQQVSVTNVLLDNFDKVNHLNHKAEIIHTKPPQKDNPDVFEIVEGVGFYEVSREDLRYADSFPRKMCGCFQTENAATAILAARIILNKWQKSDMITTREQIEKCIRDGISQTFWKGRMELVNENPFFMIDGAHNAHGVHALAGSLQELYPNEKFHFIMGVMADKDYEEMIEELLPLALDFVTVTPESNRALQSKELAECISKKGIPAAYADDMRAVIQPYLPKVDGQMEVCVQADNGGKDTVKTIAFGSLYFIGAIEAMIQEHTLEE